MTTPEAQHASLEASLAALTAELRTYVKRHDRQHNEIVEQHAAHREELREQHRELRQEVAANTQWREDRMAQERVLRWLVGSNIGVLVAVVATVLHAAGVF